MNRILQFFPHIINFLVYTMLQIFVFNKVSVFGASFCLFYIAFILLLPFEANRMLLIGLSFVLGMTIDIFGDTPGMHASVCVLIGFLRKPVENLLVPSGGYETGMAPKISSLGWGWYLTYAGILVFVHHIILFQLEAAVWGLVLLSIGKALASTVFTMGMLVIFQLTFHYKSGK